MANWNDPQDNRTSFGTSFGSAGAVGTGRTAVYDEGLRRHMLSIYNYMASGVLLTGIVALLFVNSPLFESAYQIVQTPAGAAVRPTLLGWLISASPLIFVIGWWMGAAKASQTTLQAMFWGFAVTMGLSMSTLVAVYTGASIATTFFATAGAFAGLSLFGYTTKKDLTGFGSFLIMGVWGLLLAMILNMFIGSTPFHYAISFIGVLIFAGLTAYDTQRLKNQYQYVRGTEFAGKAVILGALNLYLDFINMFQFLLQFMGQRN